MISEPGRLWGEGKSPKILPEPFRLAPPKMVAKWSPDALLTLFIWKNNREPEGGRRPKAAAPLLETAEGRPLFFFLEYEGCQKGAQRQLLQQFGTIV